MARRILSVLVCFAISLLLCGCELFAADTAELLAPPALSGELYPIAKVIDETAGGDYTFKYPSHGNYRSAVVQNDIDSDGNLEAFAFYSMSDGETVTMQVNAICLVDGVWKSVAQQKIVAGGIDSLDFCDLDNDGIQEILIGWEIYGTSEMQLAVYSLGENTLAQRMLQKYTHFVTCDLDENDKKEILIIKSSTAEQTNSASLFALTDDGITEISSCELDSAAKTFNHPIVATLSSGKPAVYIDEIKGAGAVTEVLFMEKGVLVNPLYDKDAKETLATLRSVAFSVKDINNDGIMEIPIQVDVPSVTRYQSNQRLYLTSWCSFNGEILTSQMVTMINVEDGYCYTIPSKWVGSIAVLKDTENRLREIYRYDPENQTETESLLYIKAVPKTDWDDGKYKAVGIEEIYNDGETSFICSISAAGVADGVTMEYVKSNFMIFE